MLLGASAGPAAADFSCPEGGGGEWPRLGRNLANHRCSEEKLKPNKLTREWEIHGLTGMTSVPIAKANALYFGDWTGNLHKVDSHTGAAIWTTDLGTASRATPLIEGDRVYAVGAPNQLHALDINTGAILWTSILDTHPRTLLESSPVSVGNLVIIGVASFELVFNQTDYTFRGSVVALDKDTGAEVWRVYTAEDNETSGAGVSVWSSAAIDKSRKLLYIGTGQGYTAPASPRSDAVLAIKYKTGEVAWVTQFTTGDYYTIPAAGPGPDADVGATPNLINVDGRDLVTVGSKAGVFKALDPDSGAVVWSTQLTQGSALGGVMGTAATDGELIYVNSNSWTAFGWNTNNMHNPGDTSTTFALDAASGQIVWSVPMAAPMFGAVTVANGVVYHGLINGQIFGLDGQTGAVVFQDTAPGTIGSGVSVADKRLFVGYGVNFGAGMSPDAGVLCYK